MVSFEELRRPGVAPPPPKNLSGLKKLVSLGHFVTGSGLPSFDDLLGRIIFHLFIDPLGGGLAVGSSCVFGKTGSIR